MGKFYITTPIYYVNDVPHIGHAYTTIAADVAARYHRLAGDDVWFLTGTDEHGLTNLRSAERQGLSPQELVDRNSAEFRRVFASLGIEPSDFIRTTEPRHKRVAAHIFERLHRTGDIYLGTYAGWYCTACETYYPESELGPDRTCPIHTGKPTEWTAEECYLFRLSKYQDWLLRHIEAHPLSIEPEARRNEVVAFIKSGLRDLVVSRTTFTWGVPVPFDPKHVIYVWIDALTNYISAIGYLDDPERFRRFWPADVHLMGNDIVRFHAVYWPILLHCAGIEVPRQTFAHGFLTSGGRRFSKTLGIVLDPVTFSRELAAEAGVGVAIAVDALRYFLLREVPFGSDGDFNKPALVGRFNADLANDYGNLLNRTLPLVARDFGGVLPPPGEREGSDGTLVALAQEVAAAVPAHVERLAFHQALAEVWRLLGGANKYIDEEAPWSAIRRGRRERAATILHNTLEAVRVATILLSPVLPTAAERVWAQLAIPESLRAQRLEDAARWGGLPAGLRVGQGEPIFPRIDTKAGSTVTLRDRGPGAHASDARGGAGPSPEVSNGAVKGGQTVDQITFDEFKRLDLRIAEVTAAERVPNTDKLVRLTVDLGDEVRTIVAGIAAQYQPADLVGRRIVVLANLQPRMVRGVESRGMLLAATWGDDVAILTVDGAPPKGSRVS